MSMIESWRVEVNSSEPEDMFKMEHAGPIKNAINNMKSFDQLLLNEIPDWELRLCLLSTGGHSYNHFYLQYNTVSKKTRIICKGYEHQAPSRESFALLRERFAEQIRICVGYLSDDEFWQTAMKFISEIEKIQQKMKYLAGRALAGVSPIVPPLTGLAAHMQMGGKSIKKKSKKGLKKGSKKGSKNK
jgi:hypothetical protein